MGRAAFPLVNALGVGIDLVDVARVERLLARNGDRALSRLLTDGERAYCMTRAFPARHVAARVAAKEAAYKALFQQSDGLVIGWRDFEVERDDGGQPALGLRGRALQVAERMKVTRTLLSLSHSSTHAVAIVILVG